MDKQELIKELRETFEKTKKELNFKTSFEEIDSVFYLTDLILEKKFISNDFSNQLRTRILDVLIWWDNYLHGLVMPNPQNLFMIHESKALNEADKKKMMKMMSRVAHILSKNHLLRLSSNKKEEGKLIDEMIGFWKEKYLPFMKEIMSKLEYSWKEDDK